VTSLTRYNPYAVPIQLVCQSLRRNFNQIYSYVTGTRQLVNPPRPWMHCPRACPVLAQEPKRDHGMHYQVSQDFLYRPMLILGPLPGKGGKRKQNTSKYSMRQTWASWRSYDICYIWRSNGDPSYSANPISAHQNCLFQLFFPKCCLHHHLHNST